MTARPFFVRIRSLNPWVRFREMLLGWKVRFIGFISNQDDFAALDSNPAQKAEINLVSPGKRAADNRLDAQPLSTPKSANIRACDGLAQRVSI